MLNMRQTCFPGTWLLAVVSFPIVFPTVATGADIPEKLPLTVGWARADITPPRPVAMVGQGYKRISQPGGDPIRATVLALETKSPGGKIGSQAVLVSCDLCFIRKATQDGVRRAVAEKLPDLDADKLFLNATHTHTGPQQTDGGFRGLYDVSKEPGVMKPSEYGQILIARLADAVAEAWQGRKPGGMTWALGQAVIGHNRRVVHFNGKAQMYGDTSHPDFDRFEGYEDHGLPVLFFWNADHKLTGMLINVCCPAQETEQLRVLSADFWHNVREELWKRHSKELFVLPQCGAAGDVSPHLMIRKRAERIMESRRDVSRRQEIALRIADAVDRVLPLAKKEISTELELEHTVARTNLPAEGEEKAPFYLTDTVAPVELHILRLGDVAMASNPFELYLDYGLRMQARSKADLTLTVQLACQTCGYLPTAQAVRGGGYSAVKYIVGPDGGTLLVNETVKRINALWGE